ncbi:MAG: SpoIID/LytB domain-containing protein, partial [Candidatus Limnocylindrales bacterium]
LAGQDAATILAHYYRGTTPGTTDPKRSVRILVLHGFKASATRPLQLFGRGGSWTIDGIAATFPRDAQLRVRTAGTGFRVTVRDAAGSLLLDRVTKSSLRVRAANLAAARIQVWSKPGSFDRYRGVIRLRRTASGIDAINETSLDLYLRGVVPAEMPASWPVEALRAQAIAARSYAARRLHPRTGFYDLYDDTRAQVYRGSLGEKPTTNAVVAGTAGQVLRSGTSIANTLYHSTGGGATEDNENVFTSASGSIVAGPVPYLRGSSDRAADGTPYDAGAPRASWQTAAYSLDQLSAIFGADPRTTVGALTSLDLSNVGVSGRLISVTLVGSLGSKTVSGEVFRNVFNTESPAADPYMWSTLVSTAPIP